MAISLGPSGLQLNDATHDDFADFSGGILQVKSAQYTGTTSYSVSSNGTNISVLDVNITPTSTSSKIYLACHLMVESGGGFDDHDHVGYFRRGSTHLKAPAAGNRSRGVSTWQVGYFGDDNASTPSTLGMQYIDSPNSTSQLTYGVVIQENASGSATTYINRSANDTNGDGYERGVSSLIVMEIAG